METRLPEFDQQLKLHVTGCPNSCGQHWIADIGLEGKKIKHNGKLVDAYYFCAGGSVGAWARTGRPVGYRAPATEVPDALERLLRTYLADRKSTRLNSSHPSISYAVFCLKKKIISPQTGKFILKDVAQMYNKDCGRD